MGCNLAHPAHLHLMLALALTEPTRHSSRQLPVSSPPVSSPSSAPSAASMAHPWRWCAQQPASPPRRIAPAPSALLHGEPPLLCPLLFHGVRRSGKIKLRGEIEQYGHHEVSIDGITPPTTHFAILISSLLLLPSPSMGSSVHPAFNWAFMA